MNSSLKVHWEPSDETLFRYRGSQTVRVFNLLTLRVTAGCSPSWTSTTIKTYSSFILFIFVAESKLYTYLIALLLQKKKTYKQNRYGFQRFRRVPEVSKVRCLLIHNLVTPKNMEKSSHWNYINQLLKIQIVQNFYLSSQIWYPIYSLKETVRFELLLAETRHFFSE